MAGTFFEIKMSATAWHLLLGIVREAASLLVKISVGLTYVYLKSIIGYT